MLDTRPLFVDTLNQKNCSATLKQLKSDSLFSHDMSHIRFNCQYIVRPWQTVIGGMTRKLVESTTWKDMLWYYLWGLGTLCVPNHVDYTCSCVTWFRLYGRKLTNSYVAFPKARNHLNAKNLLTDSPNHSCVIGLHHGVVLCHHPVEIKVNIISSN